MVRACPRLLLRTFEVAKTFSQPVEERAFATNGDLVLAGFTLLPAKEEVFVAG
jgi:hypothetical protein